MEQQIRVLVCDDSKLMRRLLAKMLETDPSIALIRDVGNAEECIQLLPTLQPDVVVMDIALPRMSGIDCMKVARNRGSDAEFLILSAHAQPDSPSTQEALAAGAFACIPKADGLMAMGDIQTQTLAAIREAGARALARPGRPQFAAVPVRRVAAPQSALRAPEPAPAPPTRPEPPASAQPAPPRPKERCTNCENELDVEDVYPCPLCRKPHHRTCWDANRGCAMPGCQGGKLKGTLAAIREQDERDWRTNRRVRVALVVAALVALCGFGWFWLRGYRSVHKLKSVIHTDPLGIDASAPPSPAP